MASYAIGDVQGCLRELHQLLDKLEFNPDRDTVYFLGDLVNRGPDSLGVLSFVRDLGAAGQCVLGNHDLHLLAVASGAASGKKDSFSDILGAPDRDALLGWLASQPLALRVPSSTTDAILVHAGLAPQWTAEQALALAAEASSEVRRAGSNQHFFKQLYGDTPATWSEDLSGAARTRFIVNCLTRMRFCDVNGALNMRLKGAPGSASPEWLGWFEVPERKTAGDKLVFGHWSTLGRIHWPEHNAWGLDTGCVWGGKLTAMCLETGKVQSVPSTIPPVFP